MPAQLLALHDGPSILLDKPILLFGRDLECDIRLESRKISRRHCCVAQIGDSLVIRDLGSTNGIRINGVRVVEGRVKAGDEITIGNFRYRIIWDDNAPPLNHLEKEVYRQGPTDRPPNEDEVLEECDEPVPLNEPENVAEAARIARAKPAEGSPPPKAGAHFPTHILPDELELAPSSDVMPRPPVQPPAESHKPEPLNSKNADSASSANDNLQT
ncbi:MAG: hypothetical protein KatS3mg105_1801 [Gemmatales bacterium]|nr:MAG: hypothetical protein KatS3mg105_1801 [Gemmatales bacterium]